MVFLCFQLAFAAVSDNLWRSRLLDFPEGINIGRKHCIARFLRRRRCILSKRGQRLICNP